jgi:hypothetical protein
LSFINFSFAIGDDHPAGGRAKVTPNSGVPTHYIARSHIDKLLRNPWIPGMGFGR